MAELTIYQKQDQLAQSEIRATRMELKQTKQKVKRFIVLKASLSDKLRISGNV